MRRVAQTDQTPHVEQAFEAGAQQFGGRKSDLAGRQRDYAGQSLDVQSGEHVRAQHPLGFGSRAVHQHAQAFTRQQQGQEWREHRQLARTVVAGQNHGGAAGVGKSRKALMGGVQKAGHFFWRFALDAHGQAKATHLQVAHCAVKHLAQQIGRLQARERTRPVLAAPDFLDVDADAHALIVSER